MADGAHSDILSPVEDSKTNLDAKIVEAMGIIDAAIREHAPTHMFGLFSSGNDSSCSTHLAAQHPAFTRAATIDTTIGIRESQEHGRRVAEAQGWNMLTYRPPVSYREIVKKHGFPGPAAHMFMYNMLKERCVRQLVREHKVKRFDRIMLVTGVRVEESIRRMGHVEPIQRLGAQLWVSPIINWTEEDKRAYMTRHGLPRNPVTDTICISGECCCGAFAGKEERTEIDMFYPEMGAQIADIEREAAEAGVHCKWGTRPPGKPKAATAGGMLCSTCNQRNFFELMEAA